MPVVLSACAHTPDRQLSLAAPFPFAFPTMHLVWRNHEAFWEIYMVVPNHLPLLIAFLPLPGKVSEVYSDVGGDQEEDTKPGTSSEV